MSQSKDFFSSKPKQISKAIVKISHQIFGKIDNVEVAAYHHSSRLGHSCHLCVDVVHVKGEALHVRQVFEQLKNTRNVDKVEFVSAPMRKEECC